MRFHKKVIFGAFIFLRKTTEKKRNHILKMELNKCIALSFFGAIARRKKSRCYKTQYLHLQKKLHKTYIYCGLKSTLHANNLFFSPHSLLTVIVTLYVTYGIVSKRVM